MRLQQSRPNAAALLNTNRVNDYLNSAVGEDSSLKKIEMTNKIYFNILQMLPEPILMTTLEHTICFSNAAARNLLDPKGDDLRGLPLSNFIDNPEKLNQWAYKCGRSEIFISESFHLATTERIKPITMEGCLVREGKQDFLMIRLKASPTKGSSVVSLSERVDELTKEICMRKAVEQKLQESLKELELTKKQLEELASIDGLTGIANRRSLDSIIKQEWAKSMRTSEALAVLMIDIDYFKAYNDHYGHQEGDACLKRVAQAIRGELRRPTDYVGRYGGEEFIVLLTHSDWEKAEQMASKICTAICDLNIEHQASATKNIVTISAGINVCIPSPKSSINSLIQGADEALYQAKKQGRNRFVLHSRQPKLALHKRRATI